MIREDLFEQVTFTMKFGTTMKIQLWENVEKAFQILQKPEGMKLVNSSNRIKINVAKQVGREELYRRYRNMHRTTHQGQQVNSLTALNKDLQST